MSRGAEKVFFCDKDTSSINLVKKNLNHTKLDQSKCEIINQEYNDALKTIKTKGLKADIIFLDPPYNIEGLEEIINKIFDLQLMDQQGVLILEHDINRNIDNNMIKYECIGNKKYGNTGIKIFRNKVAK